MMKILIPVFLKAFKDILRPKILSVIILPFLGSFVIWGSITWLAWDWILNLGFKLYNLALIQRFIEILSPHFLISQDPLVAVTTGAFILVVILPAAIITALFITSVILVPILVGELRKTDFPDIAKKSNSIFTGTGVSISYSLKYLFAWVGSLPLWVAIPFGPILIPYVLLAWFNSRLFTWEIMTEIASPDEIRVFIKKNSRTLFFLGLLTSILYYIPILNFVAPVIVSAAFARFCLTRFKADPPMPQKTAGLSKLF